MAFFFAGVGQSGHLMAVLQTQLSCALSLLNPPMSSLACLCFYHPLTQLFLSILSTCPNQLNLPLWNNFPISSIPNRSFRSILVFLSISDTTYIHLITVLAFQFLCLKPFSTNDEYWTSNSCRSNTYINVLSILKYCMTQHHVADIMLRSHQQSKAYTYICLKQLILNYVLSFFPIFSLFYITFPSIL